MDKKYISLVIAKVGHARLRPKKNAFKYGVFYVKIPIVGGGGDMKYPRLFSLNRWNVFSIFNKDHGMKMAERNWHEFVETELFKAKIKFDDKCFYYLITHPRIFGFAFNPISYWLVIDSLDKLRVVICEVNNTFKQSHNYLLCKKDKSPIERGDVLTADKKLFVSPFNKTEGRYEFSFEYKDNYFKSVINYFDASDRHILNTYIDGISERLTSGGILKTLFLYPLMTIMVVIRIQWQAVRLVFKRVTVTTDTRQTDYVNNETTISR